MAISLCRTLGFPAASLNYRLRRPYLDRPAPLPRQNVLFSPSLSKLSVHPSSSATSFSRSRFLIAEATRNAAVFASAGSSVPPVDPESERAKIAQVSKRLESTSRYFKRLGNLGFWGQLVCTVVAAVILSFSSIISGNITSPATFYLTSAGVAAAFVSVFWSFGYIRLSERLRKSAGDPSKASACSIPMEGV